MQAACNRTKGAHPFDSDASSMGAQAHTSCNRHAGYYVRKTAPPLAPIPRLLDYGTSDATRGDPAHGPTVPTEHINHGSVSRGRRRDSQYGQKRADSNGGDRRAEAAVKSSAGSRPLLGQRESPLPRREDDAPVFHSSNGSRTHPRTTRPVALTLRQDSRHLWQVKQATLHFRHNDHVKKGVPRRSISYPFPLPLSLSLATGTGKGDTPKGILLREGRGPRAPLLIRGSKAGPSEGFYSRLRALGLRALLLIRGSKAGPSEGFDSRLRALGLRAHYWSEVRRLAPRRGFDRHLKPLGLRAHY
jgi:hypothetical protein